jgi:hypothetical protein|tara:strand:- start:5653 stop:6549 length:897 start_codon:yes stop_codon:yes gene_type:complete
MTDENVIENDDAPEDADIEVEVEEQEAPEAPLAADSEELDESDDRFEKAESAVQKRIDRLTKKMRSAEREREEAINYARQVQGEAEQLRQRMDALDNNYVNEYSSRVETQVATAEQELARAIDFGDTNGVIESQRKLTSLALENDRAQQAKMQQDRVRQQAEQQAEQQAQMAAQQPQQPPKRPDPQAEQWASRNSWFGQDEAMTYAAFGIHKKLVEQDGFDPTSDDYYTELDKRMGNEFPHKLKSNGGSKRPAQTVASVSRGSSGRSSGKKVRLTPSQVAIAKKLGVPIEEYAKYVKD